MIIYQGGSISWKPSGAPISETVRGVDSSIMMTYADIHKVKEGGIRWLCLLEARKRGK